MNNQFGDEYIGTYNESAKDSGPVTCLGMTFDNDDARREYFRNELRNKLPELKHIEGFPIGEDDDIINLSDPPYYTACPNPWLNDFIAEWEQEKVELEKQGKRKADFQVNEPYASYVSEGKNNPIYNAHSYHTKVPHPAIMRYLLHYTQPGDIVLDSFAGTCMTGVAANMCNDSIQNRNDFGIIDSISTNSKWGSRKSIMGDISPIASFIGYNYNISKDIISFSKKANEIISIVEKECSWLYETKHSDGTTGRINYIVWSDVFLCPNCGQEIVFYDAAVNFELKKIMDEFNCPFCNSINTKKTVSKAYETTFDSMLNETKEHVKQVPVVIAYTDKFGNKYTKRPDMFDLDLLDKIENYESKYWYPIDRTCEGRESRRNDISGITHVHHFYYKRSLLALACLRHYLDIENLWLLTSILDGCAKLNRDRPFGLPSKLSGTLYIGSTVREIDVISFAKRKIKRYVDAYYEKQSGNSLINIVSACNLTLPNNSIDYIFTDPPFGANLFYSELNFLQESWLRVVTNNKEEAIINSVQGKSLFDYQTLMNRSFKEYYRVLKPGKWITIEFSNTSASVWNSIQNSLQGVGFIVANVSALDKQQGSFKAVTTTTAVKQDLVITCYKPSDELINKFNTSEDVALNAWDFIEELLLHLPVHLRKENSTTAVVERSPKILFDRLISYYVQRGYPVPMNAQDFQKGLRDRFIERDGMFFTAEQSLEYEQKRAETVSFEAAQSIFVGSEAEGIEWLKRQLDTPMAYQDLQPEWMQALVTPRKGDKLPELLQILEDNFLKDDDGRWYKPNPEKEADKMKRRTANLLKLFNRYVEEASKPKGKIKEARLEALRCGFKDCYRNKDFKTIVTVAQRLPESLVMEDEVLLLYYDIAINRV